MKIYNNPVIQRNYMSFLNQTNNLIWYASEFIPIDHKNKVLSEDLKVSIGLPVAINSLYDYQMATGYGYSRIQFLAIISICSDVEFLMKEICENLFGKVNKSLAYYQKLEKVNQDNFIPHGIDLTTFPEFLSLRIAFQIRHIAVHNMGFVDQQFNDKTGLNLQIDQQFPIEDGRVKQTIQNFVLLLDWLDKQQFPN